jgi:hypothetical protein
MDPLQTRVSFLERLRQGREAVRARNADTWRVRLEGVRGKVGDDGIERVSTQTLFDFLEVPQRGRGAGACRRLAKLMGDLGWYPIKARGLTPTGVREQIRGYARDKKGICLF